MALFAMLIAFSLLGGRGEEVAPDESEEFTMHEPGANEDEIEIDPTRDDAEQPVQA